MASYRNASRIMFGYKLAVLGFRMAYLKKYALLTHPQAREILREASENGVEIAKESGSVKSAASLLKNKKGAFEAGLFISVAKNILDLNKVYRGDIEIMSVVSAYKQYLIMRSDISDVVGDQEPFTINQCMSLVESLSDVNGDVEAEIKKCTDCGSTFYFAYDTKAKNHCPWCNIKH